MFCLKGLLLRGIRGKYIYIYIYIYIWKDFNTKKLQEVILGWKFVSLIAKKKKLNYPKKKEKIALYYPKLKAMYTLTSIL